MSKIGIFFAPKGGSTEKVAKKIQAQLPDADLHCVADIEISEMLKYDKLILGIATIGKETWDQDYKKSGWDLKLPVVENTDFSGKTVALFGLGDSVTYGLNFVDAMGILGRTIKKQGGKLVGFTDTKDYNFTESQAIENDQFMGLPIDEDFEDEKTNERITQWIKELNDSML
ncbi:MAG: flavodoxin [Salinivirgaceae bacterium]|jgi:flavodoxin I|nr:flavodoxin [Salinivirgaceae bacterium]